MRIEAFSPRHADWNGIAAAAKAAETAGFDCFATPEIENDPFVTMAIAGHATERVTLRTAIAVAFPRSPMTVATSSWEINANTGGRFSLGLGTQVKGHNERRFSVKWSKPRTRLREYIESLRAIWRCWQFKERLAYEGEFYQFSLMTPEFSPPPNDFGPIPVHTAAVRPRMLRLAGEVADGVRLHGFATRKYLETVALPEIEAGLAESGRKRENFEVCGGGFVVTGPDDASVARMFEFIRKRVAFYGSTRTYLPVFQAHGWEDLGAKLHAMSKANQWKDMPAQVPDDVVHAFAAVGRYDQLKSAVEKRFGGISDSVEIAAEATGGDLGTAAEAVAELKTIDTRFKGFAGW